MSASAKTTPSGRASGCVMRWASAVVSAFFSATPSADSPSSARWRAPQSGSRWVATAAGSWMNLAPAL